MIHSEDLDLCEAYLEMELEGEELKEFEFRLCTEDDLARLLIQTSSEEIIIREWAELQRAQSWFEKLVNQNPPRESRNQRAKIFSVAVFVIAVCVVAWFGAFSLTHSNRNPSIEVTKPAQPVAAALIAEISDGVLKSQSQLFDLNDILLSGRAYTFDGRVLRLEMKSGTSVLVAGPATFQLLSQNGFQLQQGILTADVPQQAIGFAVDTPTLKVIDLGTRFGVHVDEKGSTETHVFQGLVNCFSGVVKNQNRQPRRLEAGQSVKQLSNGNTVESQLDSETLFSTCLQHESHIRQLSGNMKLLSRSPESVAMGECTSNDHIFVFQEQRNFILPSDLNCNLPIPEGLQHQPENEAQKQFGTGVIKKGTKVNVYYIHNDAHYPGHPEFSEKKTRFTMTGAIGFQNKVLGILQTDELLLQSDNLLGDAEVRYTNGGINQRNRVAEDKIELLPDGRTLSLEWVLSRGNGHQSVNAMRVIVAAEEN